MNNLLKNNIFKNSPSLTKELDIEVLKMFALAQLHNYRDELLEAIPTLKEGVELGVELYKEGEDIGEDYFDFQSALSCATSNLEKINEAILFKEG